MTTGCFEFAVLPLEKDAVDVRRPSLEQDFLAAGCDDALVSVTAGELVIDFSREAPSLGHAVASALVDVVRIVPGKARVAFYNDCDIWPFPIDSVPAAPARDAAGPVILLWVDGGCVEGFWQNGSWKTVQNTSAPFPKGFSPTHWSPLPACPPGRHHHDASSSDRAKSC